MIPAVLWIFLCLFEKGSPKGRGLRLKEGWSITENGKSILGEKSKECRGQTGFWLLLASGSLAILLSCLMTAGFGLLFALREKQIGILVKGALACLPGAVYVLLYVALTHGLLV